MTMDNERDLRWRIKFNFCVDCHRNGRLINLQHHLIFSESSDKRAAILGQLLIFNELTVATTVHVLPKNGWVTLWESFEKYNNETRTSDDQQCAKSKCNCRVYRKIQNDRKSFSQQNSSHQMHVNKKRGDDSFSQYQTKPIKIPSWKMKQRRQWMVREFGVLCRMNLDMDTANELYFVCEYTFEIIHVRRQSSFFFSSLLLIFIFVDFNRDFLCLAHWKKLDEEETASEIRKKNPLLFFIWKFKTMNKKKSWAILRFSLLVIHHNNSSGDSHCRLFVFSASWGASLRKNEDN